MGETCSTHGIDGMCTEFNWKTVGMILLGRFKLRCHNNTKMDQKYV